MTRLEIATLACKIIALWVLVQAAYYLVNVVYMVVYLFGLLFGSQGTHSELSNAAVGVEGVGLSLLSLFLWFQAPRLAKRMVSSDPTPITGAGLTKDDVMTIAFSTVGVYIFIEGLEQLAWVLLHGLYGSETSGMLWANLGWRTEFLSAVISAALGGWLTLGSRGIVNFLKWLRTAGVHTDNA
jgi:hypothetical protein